MAKNFHSLSSTVNLAPNIRAWDPHVVLFSKLVFNKVERQFYQTENLAKV